MKGRNISAEKCYPCRSTPSLLYHSRLKCKERLDFIFVSQRSFMYPPRVVYTTQHATRASNFGSLTVVSCFFFSKKKDLTAVNKHLCSARNATLHPL